MHQDQQVNVNTALQRRHGGGKGRGRIPCGPGIEAFVYNNKDGCIIFTSVKYNFLPGYLFHMNVTPGSDFLSKALPKGQLLLG